MAGIKLTPTLRRGWPVRLRAKTRRPWLLTLLAGAVALLMLLPLGYLLVRAFEGGSDTWRTLLRPTTVQVLFGSAALALTTTLSAMLVALPLAWLTMRTDLPLRRFWSIATLLPLAIPSYIGTFGLIVVLGPRGTLQSWLAPLGVEQLPSIYGFGGAALALTLFSYPYVLLSLRAALRRMDPSTEEAARALGDNPLRAFLRVTLPQLRPSLTAGGLLVALYTLSDFGAVSLMQYNAFTRAIFLQYRASFNRQTAAVLALLLVALTVGILVAEVISRGRARYYRSSAGTPRPPNRVKLGRWRWPALIYCSVVVGFAVVLPVGAMLMWLVAGIRSGVPFNTIGTHALNSMLAAGLAAGVAVLAALPIVVLSVRYPGRLSQVIERSSYVGYALPGIVVALALVFFGARYAIGLYQTLVMLVFAYVVLFLPQAVGAIRARMLQINPHYEEAARTLGRTPLQVMRSITMPLLIPGLLAGAALVFLTTMKELPATLLLAPTGYSTLATKIWSASSEGMFARAAAPALLLIGLSAISLRLLLKED